MHYVVFLAIASRDGLTIAVVGAPFALKRGGASARPRAFLLYRLQIESCQVIFKARGLLEIKKLISPRVAKLVNAVALGATGIAAFRVRLPARGPSLLYHPQIVPSIASFYLTQYLRYV
jgi:hypothetical protein